MLCIMFGPMRGIQMEIIFSFIKGNQLFIMLSIIFMDKNVWRCTNVEDYQ